MNASNIDAITLMSPMHRKKKPMTKTSKACVVFNMIILMNIAFVEKLPQYLEVLRPEVNNRTLTRTEN
jgi:hypothetical protein